VHPTSEHEAGLGEESDQVGWLFLELARDEWLGEGGVAAG
jgi:hypothetical protein